MDSRLRGNDEEWDDSRFKAFCDTLEGGCRKSRPPAVILAKAGIHLAFDSLFQRNNGEPEESGFQPFCNTHEVGNPPQAMDPHLHEDDSQ